MTTTEQRTQTLHPRSLALLRWTGVIAALASAGVHFLLGVRMFPDGLGISFLVAGLGFLAGIALVLADVRRRAVYALGIPFTLGQIVLWYLFNFTGDGKSFPGDIGTLGAIDKIAQVILIIVVAVLLWDSS
jgi:hypothetical protein